MEQPTNATNITLRYDHSLNELRIVLLLKWLVELCVNSYDLE